MAPAGESRGVEEMVNLEELARNPSAVVQMQNLALQRAEKQLAELKEQNAAFQRREQERIDAERTRLENERAAAEQAHKDNMNQSRLKLEAALRTALNDAKLAAPEVVDDGAIERLTGNFHADLEAAGYDEAAMTEVMRKANDNVDLIVRASRASATQRADRERRETAKAIDMLKPHFGTSFTISGGFAQPIPEPVNTPAASTSMFGGAGAPPPHQQQQQVAAESGTMLASATPSVGGIFAGVLTKRSASEIGGYDGNSKRSVVSETVPMAKQAAAPATADVDFSSPDWMLQVLTKSLAAGEGVPSEKTLRHGGFGVVRKEMASVNGGTVVQNQRAPRLTSPYTGPITMAELNPEGFKYCVERIKEVFAGKVSRPQVRTINEHMEVSAAFPTQAASFIHNTHLLPPQFFSRVPNFYQ